MFESPQYKAIPTHHSFVAFDIDTFAVHSKQYHGNKLVLFSDIALYYGDT